MLLITIFVLGYVAIIFEHLLKLNKSAAALLTGVLCWTAYVSGKGAADVEEKLLHHMGELSQVLFFLLTAMTIVEVIDAHDGFDLVTSRITTKSRRKLLVTIAAFAFFLSAALDNLTTAIVMMTLVRRLVADPLDRMLYGGVVVVAANAGGAWSPIGDVTTTMLWVGQQITTPSVIRHLFLPSLVSVAVPVAWIAVRMRGEVPRPKRAFEPGASSITLPVDAAAVGKTLAQMDLRARTGGLVLTIARDGGEPKAPLPRDVLRAGDQLALGGEPEQIERALDLLVTGEAPKKTSVFERRLVFGVGVGVLLFVPVFKTITHLPPMMGILLGLGILWLVTEIVHKKDGERREALSVVNALQRIDAQSVLFFLGILLAISALESDGVLAGLAQWLDRTIGNVDLITMTIGLSSSVVDNVPLVAAAQGMYPATTFPTDHSFWLFLAYCAGVGGSILIIGSAAGIAVMGIERITFGWYVRRFSLPSLIGYLAGALTYLAETKL